MTPILFGRNPERLHALFPELRSYRNDEIVQHLGRVDAIVHLAAVNSDARTDASAEIGRVNVAWPIKLAQLAQRASVRRFVFISSTHAFEPGKLSAYAQSKRDAAEGLRKLGGVAVSEIVAPKIYHAHGGPFYTWFWRTLSALKPTASTAELSSAIARELRDDGPLNQTVLLAKRHDVPVIYQAFTTILDISFALVVLIVFGWLLLFVAVAVRLDSPGPALFRQIRIGKSKREFVCWKFRTMRTGSANRATHEMTADSITRLGSFLRRSKIDELPQVVNLLRRELSLVGPRPCLPNQRDLIEQRSARGVYQIRPGITGLAQINGVDMSDPRNLAMWDERYLGLRSIVIDIRILISTLVGRGNGDRVGAAPEDFPTAATTGNSP